MSLSVSQEFSNQIERWNRSQFSVDFKISSAEIQEIANISEVIRSVALDCLNQKIERHMSRGGEGDLQNYQLSILTDNNTNRATVYLRTPSGKHNAKYTSTKKLQKGYQLNFSFTKGSHDLKLIDFKPVTILGANNSSRNNITFETNRDLLKKEIYVTQKLQTVAGVCRHYSSFSYHGKQKYFDDATQSIKTKPTQKLSVYQEFQGASFEKLFEELAADTTTNLRDLATPILYNLALILKELHAQGITHNNINPNTVFFRPSAQPGNPGAPELFIGDFNLAQDSVPPHEIDYEKELKVDPEYCCTKHRQLDRAAQPANDIWSTGTLIMELLNIETSWSPFLKLSCFIKDILQLEMFNESRQLKADEAPADEYLEGYIGRVSEALDDMYDDLKKIEDGLCVDLNSSDPQVADTIKSFHNKIHQCLIDFDSLRNRTQPEKLTNIKAKLFDLCTLIDQSITKMWDRLDRITPPKIDDFRTEHHNVMDYIIWGMLRPFACHRITSEDIIEWLQPFAESLTARRINRPRIRGSILHNSTQLRIGDK